MQKQALWTFLLSLKCWRKGCAKSVSLAICRRMRWRHAAAFRAPSTNTLSIRVARPCLRSSKSFWRSTGSMNCRRFSLKPEMPNLRMSFNGRSARAATGRARKRASRGERAAVARELPAGALFRGDPPKALVASPR
jgi:hypothetical protein